MPKMFCRSKTETVSVLERAGIYVVKGRWFHSVQIIPSLIGEKPGVNRNHFQKDFEKFFMRPGLFAQFYYTVKTG